MTERAGLGMSADPAPSRPDPGDDTSARQPTVLISAADAERRAELTAVIELAGWLALVAPTGDEALHLLRHAPPDLLLIALEGTSGNELELLDRVRNDVGAEDVPIVCLLDRRHRRLTIEAFGRRADDVVSGHPHPTELIARFRSRIERRAVPQTMLIEDPVTGALTTAAFAQQLDKECERVTRGGRPGALAVLSLDELPELTAKHGSRARDELIAQIVRLIARDGRQLDFVGTSRGLLTLLLPGTPKRGAQTRFDRLARVIYDHDFELGDATIRLTPLIGYTQTLPEITPTELESRAWDALRYQSDQLDLHPTRWVRAMSPTTDTKPIRQWFERLRTPLQVLAQQVLVFGLPLVVYVALAALGIDITGTVYLLLVGALGFTALGIVVECRAARGPTEPPDAPDGAPPLASAIIAAYLPNEAGTVVETVNAFLEQDYPNLEVILAYNTPRTLDVEQELKAIAERDPRFRPLRVDGSVSKAQNVNAAINHVRGEFVGLFDADHHPAPGSFERAWRWLGNGAGVVQGHCVIRNGDTNFVTRLVATEFESIYAVSHPGRARLHGFGIFGGSNGYWHTSLLHRIRLRGSMLTEDIDSSMRVVQSGREIISDPGLVSTELAPDTVGALWNQRLRWAQGWSQVSLRHLVAMVRGAPSTRQRLGVAYLLGWRELYPWISLQMFPLIVYWWLSGAPPFDWFVPIFMFTSLVTLSAGPVQTWYAWRLAHPDIKRHRRWFVSLLVSSLVFYTEFKNIVARTAHLKEVMRERKWKVTPRAGSVAVDDVPSEPDQRLVPRPSSPTSPHGIERGIDFDIDMGPALHPSPGRHGDHAPILNPTPGTTGEHAGRPPRRDPVLGELLDVVVMDRRHAPARSEAEPRTRERRTRPRPPLRRRHGVEPPPTELLVIDAFDDRAVVAAFRPTIYDVEQEINDAPDGLDATSSRALST